MKLSGPRCKAKKIAQIIIRVIPLALLLLYLNSTTELNHLGPDSLEYLAFTDDVLTGRLFTSRTLDEIPIGSVIRTPGFPVVLTLGRLLYPEDIHSALFVSHSVLFSFVFILFSVLARAFMSTPILGLLLFPALIQMRPIFAALASEWTAFCLLLLLIPCLQRFFNKPNESLLFCIGAIVSLITLTRPALCITVTLPLIFVMLLKAKSWPSKFVSGLLSLSLLWIWMGFNWYRLGSISLAPRGGVNIFCVGAMIGKASPHVDDPPELQKFIHDLNKEITPLSPTEMAEERSLDISTDFFSKYLKNNGIADTIALKSGINRVTENEYLRIYGIRSIRENIQNYLLHLEYGAHNFALTGYLLLPALFLPIFWIRNKRFKELSLTVLTLLYIHVGHLVLVLITQPLLSRYYSVTLYPLLVTSVMITYCFGRDLYQNRNPAGT